MRTPKTHPIWPAILIILGACGGGGGREEGNPFPTTISFQIEGATVKATLKGTYPDFGGALSGRAIIVVGFSRPHPIQSCALKLRGAPVALDSLVSSSTRDSILAEMQARWLWVAGGDVTFFRTEWVPSILPGDQIDLEVVFPRPVGVQPDGDFVTLAGVAEPDAFDGRPHPTLIVRRARLRPGPRSPWVLRSVHTGPTDVVKLKNESGTPLSVDGLGITTTRCDGCHDPSAAGAGIPRSKSYVCQSHAIIAPGGEFVIEDGGQPGSPLLSPGITGPGERTGADWEWDDSTHDEVVLVGSATLVNDEAAGESIDCLAFRTSITPAPADIPLHLNPPGPGGLWLSGAVLRLPGQSVMTRVIDTWGCRDTDTSADWYAGIAPGLPGAPSPATPGLDLGMSLGPSGFRLDLVSGTPSRAGLELYNLLSPIPAPFPGAGPILGLDPFVIAEIFTPPGTEPFHVRLDVCSEYSYVLPVTLPPGLHGTLQARSVVVDPDDAWSLNLSNIFTLSF